MTEGIVWFIKYHLRNNHKILVPPDTRRYLGQNVPYLLKYPNNILKYHDGHTQWTKAEPEKIPICETKSCQIFSELQHSE